MSAWPSCTIPRVLSVDGCRELGSGQVGWGAGAIYCPTVPLSRVCYGERVDANHRFLLFSAVGVGNREKVDASHRLLMISVVCVGNGENGEHGGSPPTGAGMARVTTGTAFHVCYRGDGGARHSRVPPYHADPDGSGGRRGNPRLPSCTRGFSPPPRIWDKLTSGICLLTPAGLDAFLHPRPCPAGIPSRARIW